MGMIGIGDATTGPQATVDVVDAMTPDAAYTYMTQMSSGDLSAMDPTALDLLTYKAQSSSAYLTSAGYTKTGAPAATATVPTQTKWLLAIAAGFVLIVMMRR